MEDLHELLQGYRKEKTVAGRKIAADHFFDSLNLLVARTGEAIGRRYLLDDYSKDEIVSKCLIKYWQWLETDLEKLLAINNWQAWLFRGMQFSALDALRKDGRENKRVTRPGLPEKLKGSRKETTIEDIGNPSEGQESMKKKILEEQILLLLEKEIARIANPVRKRVFELYQSGHTQQQIARETGEKVSSVNNWIDRTKKKIISDVRQHCIERGLL